MLKDEIEELQGSVKTMEKEVKEQTLALELLKEVKKSARRWFVISIILLVVLIVSNVAWLIYESQWEYVTEETTQTIDDIDNTNNTNFTQHIN